MKLESPEWIGIVRRSAESLLEGPVVLLPVVLLVIGPRWIRRECSSDGFRNRRWRGNMGTLGTKTVLISRVLDSDGGSVGRLIRITALDHLYELI